MWISKHGLLVTFFFLAFAISANAQNDQPSYATQRQIRNFRSGVRVAPFPILSYDTDLGFRLGAAADLYDYGKNPSYYPLYRYRLHADASYYFRGKGVFDVNFDAPFLIPDTRFVADVSYQFDPLYSFYGLGGSLTPYDRSLDRSEGNARYSMRRNVFSAKAFISGTIIPHLNCSAGLSYWNFYISDTDFSGYDPQNTVYRDYVNAGIIRQNEASGGNVLEMQTGLSFDNRNSENRTSNGILASIICVGGVDAFGSGYNYLKLCAQFSQYVTPVSADWLTFAYHLAYQGTMAGETPFYMQSQIYNYLPRSYATEGLGGYGTLRGIMTARLLGEGYAWGNLELRFRLFDIVRHSNEFFLSLVPFFDTGVITQPSRLEEFSKWYSVSSEDLSRIARNFHYSAGLGIKFGLNDNIISLDIAKPFNNDDARGAVSFCIGTNYLF